MNRHTMRSVGAAFVLVAAFGSAPLGGCASIIGFDDYERVSGKRPGGIGGSGGSGAAGGSGGEADGGGGRGASISTSSSGGGGAGGEGGGCTPSQEICGNGVSEDCDAEVDEVEDCRLIDRGLLVRYFIDEAASGRAPAALQDAALGPGPTPQPLPLTITYGSAYFTEVDMHRGFWWPFVGSSARAATVITGTKIEQLNGSKTGTIEVVVEIDDVSVNQSPISWIGVGTGPGRFSLTASTSVLARFDLYGSGHLVNTFAGAWAINFATLNRCVLHVVLDTALADEGERVKLYVSGTPEMSFGTSHIPPIQDETIALGSSAYVLGNIDYSNPGRSFQGTLFYAALYSEALTVNEIRNNAAVLQANDDTPP
jgi:hypothetical protein